VRVQLRRRRAGRPLRRAALAAGGLLAAALLAVMGHRPARANTDSAASARITYFREPSTNNAGISVVHPQLDLSAALGPTFSLSAGYEVDIVTGATPRVFGPVDAVSAATHFSDTRQQVKGGFAFDRPSSGVSAGYSYGWESDYKSSAVSATTRSDLLDHNFTLALAYTHNFDQVCDANNSAAAGQPLDLKPLPSSAHCFQSGMADVVTHHLSIDTFEPSLTWTATPRLVVQGGTTLQIIDGFQSNPYRSVLVGSQNRTPQENMPLLRQRYALFGRAAYALPDARASFMALVRIYRDSWAVQSATADFNLNKYLGPLLLASLRGRYHQQTGASFYRTGADYRSLGPAGQYWTGDRELSPMSNFLVGGKLSFLRRPEQEKTSWFSEIELALKLEGLFYQLPAGAPNSDRSHALIGQLALVIRF
jgi:hypothetical protein